MTNSYNEVKDILTDIFDLVQDSKIDEIKNSRLIDAEKEAKIKNVTVICQSAKNHALNQFETTYRDCKIKLDNL